MVKYHDQEQLTNKKWDEAIDSQNPPLYGAGVLSEQSPESICIGDMGIAMTRTKASDPWEIGKDFPFMAQA